MSLKSSTLSSNILNKHNIIRKMKRHWGLYLLLLPPLIYIIIFHYIPMFGIQIAFRNFIPTDGLFGSPWVGFLNFQKFFKSYVFWRVIKNTLGLNLYWLFVSSPIPIILAIAVNEVTSAGLKKTVQMVTYAPHFISMAILVSMVMQILSPHTGIVNNIIKLLGGQPVNFMGEAAYFKSIFVWSGVWQQAGYSSIIYIAALAGIDLQLYEAAVVDGASKLKRIWYIDIPGILPTAVILLVLHTGRIMNIGFEKIYLMQNSMNISSSEVISTYVYKVGLINGNYSFSTAIGLFNSLINLMLIVLVNKAARKFSDTSLW